MWWLYALIAAAFWGLDYTLSDRVLKYQISPVTLLTVEMALGSLFFGIMSLWGGSLREDFLRLKAEPQLAGWMLSAIVVFNVASFFIFLSIQTKNATSAGLIELCYPLFTLLFSYILFREYPVQPAIWLGAVLIFVGALFVGSA